MVMLTSIQEESGSFFKDNPSSEFVDKVQKASEQLQMMKNVSESQGNKKE